MNDNQCIEKKCENCRHYCLHYSKGGTRYFPIHCGHCVRGEEPSSTNPSDCCKYWEDIIEKKEARRRSVKEAIIDMSERLDELTIILQDNT